MDPIRATPTVAHRREAVKARGLLLTDALAQAAHEGRKTQTRRPVNPQPIRSQGANGWTWKGMCFGRHEGDMREAMRERCPFGVPGDLLYVRECWTPRDGTSIYHRAKKSLWFVRVADQDECHRWWMKMQPPASHGRWVPNIHMPRWAARTWLRITNVRVERLCQITEAALVTEGVPDTRNAFVPDLESTYFTAGIGRELRGRRGTFAETWDRIYHRKGLGWDANPWVWVLEWEKTEAPDGR